VIARFSASPSASFFSLDVQKIKTQTNKPEHKVFYVSFIPCFTFSTISHNSQVSVLSTISHNSQVFVLSTISHNSQVFVLSTISHNSQVFVLSTISHNSQVFVLSTISHNSQVFVLSTISHNSQVFVLSTISHNSQVFVLSTISHNSQVFVLSTIHPRLGFFSMQVTSSLPLSTCVPTFITISSCLFLTYSCILLHPFFLCSFCGFAGRVIRSVYKFLQSYYVF